MSKESYTMIIMNNNTGQFKKIQLSETTNTHAKVLMELDRLQKENLEKDIMNELMAYDLWSTFNSSYQSLYGIKTTQQLIQYFNNQAKITLKKKNKRK